MPPASAVARPIATAAAAEAGGPRQHRAAAARGDRRPAATIVAACSSADTEVGPAMARNSQGENGSWPDLAAAETQHAEGDELQVRPAAASRSASKANEPGPGIGREGGDEEAEIAAAAW